MTGDAGMLSCGLFQGCDEEETPDPNYPFRRTLT
jgi:hypothetical protein